MSRSLKACAALVLVTGLVAGLAGCAPEEDGTGGEASTSTATPSPTQTESTESKSSGTWWEEQDPDENLTLNDATLYENSKVDPEGIPDSDYVEVDASAPDAPAEIFTPGKLYIHFSFRTGEVARSFSEGYLTKNEDGSGEGPAFECSSDGAFVPQDFNCVVQFQDSDYSDGTYYGVIKLLPLNASDEAYGEMKLIIPVYTKAREE